MLIGFCLNGRGTQSVLELSWLEICTLNLNFLKLSSALFLYAHPGLGDLSGNIIDAHLGWSVT